jgi:hypothetical protein
MGSRWSTKNLLLTAGVVIAAALIILIAIFAASPHKDSSRSESYKKSTGTAAGLTATIAYDCHKCKPTFDFNVYVFTENGQQAAIVRPNDKGQINAALPEGEYVLLISKQFGKDKVFPEEHISLKNGKQLELKLQYGRVAS